MSKDETFRRYDIDWLRNFCILLLFPFHAARIFDLYETNYVRNSELSMVLTMFIWVTSYWFMPLMFWLAGSSSWYALKKRTPGQYKRERFSRLFIPFVFGLLIIVPPQGYMAKLGMGYKESYLQFLKSYFTNFSDLSGYTGGFSPDHLWFLLYLFMISAALLPILLHIKRKISAGDELGLVNILKNPVFFILSFIPLTIVLIIPSPGGKNPFFYAIVYLLGYIVCTDDKFQLMIDNLKLKALIVLIFNVPVWLFIAIKSIGASDLAPISILEGFTRNLALVLTLIVISGYANKGLRFKSRILPYMNEAAMPVYILHQTIMMIVGYYIVKLPVGIGPKFILIMISTFVLSLGLYEFVIRRTTITRWLFGVKSARKESKISVQA